MTWKNGGGLFILLYILCIVLVGLPILISEITIGKLSQKNPFGAFQKLDRFKSPFRFLGLLGILSAFMLLSYYSVIAGWGIEYELKSIQNKFGRVSLTDMNHILLAEEAQLSSNVNENRDITSNQSQDLPDIDRQLEKITKIIANSSSKMAVSIKTAAIRDSISEGLTPSVKRALLMDAGLITATDELTDIELNQTFEHNTGSLIQQIKKNKTFKKWADLFFKEKAASQDYYNWLQESFLPPHSSYMFNKFIGDPQRMILWHGIIMLIIFLIALKGIRAGIEIASKFGMIMLFCIMLFLMINSLISDPMQKGIKFLLWGDPSKLNKNSFLEALGQAFFTLSLGLGAMITYGSYLKETSNTISNAVIITLMDMLVAFVACLMIFPIIFVYGLTPSGDGIGILFTALPLKFAKFSGGQYLSILFYFLVLLAAITSAMSLLEVVITYFQDEFNITRFGAALVSASLIFIAGIPSALSLNFLGAADLFISCILLPVGGFFTAVFMGYKMDMGLIENEFKRHDLSIKLFFLFKISIKYISPLLVFLILIQTIYNEFL